MGKKKQDLSKLDKKNNDESRGFLSKLFGKDDEEDKEPDFSNLTTAEYEMRFLQKFNEEEKDSGNKKKDKNQLLSQLEQGIAEERAGRGNRGPLKQNDVKLKEISAENKQKIKLSTKTKPNPPEPKYGVKMDFSWVDKKVEYVRHCPMCNNFVKTDDSTQLRCPKCNTKMNFAIYCDSCNLWFDVKSAKKYPCPKCAKIISHGNYPE